MQEHSPGHALADLAAAAAMRRVDRGTNGGIKGTVFVQGFQLRGFFRRNVGLTDPQFMHIVSEIELAKFIHGSDGQFRTAWAPSLCTNTTSSSPSRASARSLPMGTAPRGIASTKGCFPWYSSNFLASRCAACSRWRNCMTLPSPWCGGSALLRLE